MNETTQPQFHVTVIGAGAAGLMAALFASRNGATVVLIERTREGGKKILISGGGRCNILPAHTQPERFVTSSSKHSLKNMLKSWPLEEQRAFFETELEQPLVLEPDTGKLFPQSSQAREVRDGLLRRLREAGAILQADAQATRIEPPQSIGHGWTVVVNGRDRLTTHCVILATGGLSVPKTGSDGFGLQEARRLGIAINTTYPALTPLVASPPPHQHLAGISLDVSITAPNTRPRFQTSGGFLFTHRGYSGPAILNASHLAVRSTDESSNRCTLEVSWTSVDADHWNEMLGTQRGRVLQLVSRYVPNRLAEQLLTESGLSSSSRLDQLTRPDRKRLIRLLTAYPLPWTGHEGYKKAEVTGGGVALSEIDPRTMECRRHDRLYLCGELLDAFGPIGGFNFQWAWATGRAAGVAAANR